MSPSNFDFRPRIKLHIYLKTGSLWFECHFAQTVALQKPEQNTKPRSSFFDFLKNSCKDRKSNCPQDPKRSKILRQSRRANRRTSRIIARPSKHARLGAQGASLGCGWGSVTGIGCGSGFNRLLVIFRLQ